MPKAADDHTARRLRRARELSERYPHAREALDFYSRLIEFDGGEADLRELVIRYGPSLLRESARAGTEPAVTFFRRALERLHPPCRQAPHSNRCPQCGGPPQVGVLREQGHGEALLLVCSTCLVEWPFPRRQCPHCGTADQLAFYSADLLPHLETQMCDACRRYLHLVHLAKDPAAVPDVDEVAALPLDVWAIEQGFEKIQQNLIGI
ncbi:MAG: formate dehydrogenase accessory protein FdhE [Bryobacteraceae bacterium]